MAITDIVRMLYDVLPPAVFLTSLGGITLVVSRVVLRLRRQHNLPTSVSKVNPALAGRATNLAALVGPTQKSVHVIKNRLALIRHLINQTLTRVREKRQPHSTTHSAPDTDNAQPLAQAAPLTPPRARYISAVSTYLRHALTQGAAKLKTASAAVSKVRGPLGKQRPPTAEHKFNTQPPVAKSKLILRMINKRQDVTSTVATKNTLGDSAKVAATQYLKKSLKVAGAAKLRRSKIKKDPLQKAQAAMSQAQYQLVETLLVPYLAKHPKNTPAYLLLGKAALARHAWDEAREIFEQAVRLSPNIKNGQADLGYAALKAGKFTQALESLQKAHDAEPHNIKVIKRLLIIARRMDNIPLKQSLLAELTTLKETQQQPN